MSKPSSRSDSGLLIAQSERPTERTPTTRTIAGELAGKRADGTEFPVEIRVSLLDAQGQRSIVGIVRDVTERNRAQQVQQRLVHDLGERVKELTALHATSRLLNEPGTPRELLARIVTLLPPGVAVPGHHRRANCHGQTSTFAPKI